jgi:hypothetical protein
VTVYQGTLNLHNSILTGNRADTGAGIHLISTGHANLYHVTAVDNCQRQNNNGSVLYNKTDGRGSVYNSLFRNNVPITYSEIHDAYGKLDVNYTQLMVVWSGTSTLGENSLEDCLLDANYGLPAGSACIDSAYGLPGLAEHDYDGRLRVDDPDVKNTGGGSPDYYDRGARERIP